MVELSRRSFLKAIGVTSAGIVLPTFDILMPKANILPAFRMRPVAQYDINQDTEMLRYDVFDGKTQLHVSATIDGEMRNDKKVFIERAHRPLVAVMKNALFQRRIPPSRLKPLPMPPGYRHPEWLREILYG